MSDPEKKGATEEEFVHTFDELHKADADPEALEVQLAEPDGDLAGGEPSADQVDPGAEPAGEPGGDEPGGSDTDERLRALEEQHHRQQVEEQRAMQLRQLEEHAKQAEAEENKKLEALRAKKREAIEKGDTDAILSLDEEITDVRAERKLRERELGYLRKQAGAGPGEGGEPKAKEPGPAAKAWVERNRWFADARYAPEAAYARAKDREIMREGKLDPNTPAYFEELDRRVAKAFPDLVKPKNERRRENTPRLGPAGGDPPSRPANRSSVKLTSADLAQMRTFGLDPKNPAHLKAFAAERRASAR